MEDELTNSALEELASWHVRLARRTGDRQLLLTASRRVLALRRTGVAAAPCCGAA